MVVVSGINRSTAGAGRAARVARAARAVDVFIRKPSAVGSDGQITLVILFDPVESAPYAVPAVDAACPHREVRVGGGHSCTLLATNRHMVIGSVQNTRREEAVGCTSDVV